MLTLTKVLMMILGASALIIGAMIFTTGPHATAQVFGSLFALAFQVEAYSGTLSDANIDSELRFYAVFWMAYGAALFWIAARKLREPVWVLGALGLFGLGGVGRLLSLLSVGAPDMLFFVLMLVELVGPLVVAFIYAVAMRRHRSDL